MIHLKDEFLERPSGVLVLDVFRHGKQIDHIELVEHFEGPNLIVANSKQVHAHLLGGDVAGRSVTQFSVGTNGSAPAAGNTTITNQFAKGVDQTTYPATNQVQFAFSLAPNEANGMAIMEFGLLTAAGVLYARKTRLSALNKESDLSFAGTWTISF